MLALCQWRKSLRLFLNRGDNFSVVQIVSPGALLIAEYMAGTGYFAGNAQVYLGKLSLRASNGYCAQKTRLNPNWDWQV